MRRDRRAARVLVRAGFVLLAVAGMRAGSLIAQTVGDSAEYVAAIEAANQSTPPSDTTITITGGATVVPGVGATIAIGTGSTMTIDGGGSASLSGADALTPLVVASGDVTLRDLEISSGLARGGDGSGGGAGLGGGAFVAAGAAVTMDRVTFSNNAAVGGNGGFFGGAGGDASFLLGATNATGQNASPATAGAGGFNLADQVGAGAIGGAGAESGLPGNAGTPPEVSGGGGVGAGGLGILGGGMGGVARSGAGFAGGPGGGGGYVGGGGASGTDTGGGGGGGAYGGGGGAGFGDGGLGCGGGGGGGFGGGGGSGGVQIPTGPSFCQISGYGNGGGGGGGFGGGAGFSPPGVGSGVARGGFGGGIAADGGGGGGGFGAGGHVFVMAGGTLRLIDPVFGASSIAGGAAGGAGAGGGGAIGVGIFVGGDVAVLLSNGGTLTVSTPDFFGGSGDPAAGAQAGGALIVGDATHAGQLVLAAPNSYAGVTHIDAGVLTIDDPAGLGTGLIEFGGGTLQYGAGVTTDFSPRFDLADSQPYTIDTNGNDVTFAMPLVSNGGSLTKLGAGTLQLTAAGTYSGATLVQSGTLQLDNSIESSVADVVAGAALTGLGRAGALLTNDGIVMPGDVANDATAVLGVAGAYAQSGSGTLSIAADGTSTQSSALSVGGSATLAGTLRVAIAGGAPATGTVYTVLTASSIGGTFATIDVSGLGAGQSADVAYDSDRVTVTIRGPVDHFDVTAPASVVAEAPFAFTVVARDATNAIVSGYAGTVHFTSTDPAASLPPDASLTGGTGSFTATLYATGTRAIAAGDVANPSITGVSAPIAITPPTIDLTPATLPGAVVGSAYSVTIGATGGIAPYTFALKVGNLPPGLALGADGTLSGTLAAAGSFDFTLAATDAYAYTGMRAYSLAVATGTSATALASAPNPSAPGETITFTATVTTANGPTPTGAVTFAEGAEVLAVVPLDASGQAVFTTSSLAEGSHTVTASYPGDANVGASSASVVQDVVAGSAPAMPVPTLGAWAALTLMLGLGALAGLARHNPERR